MPQLKSVFIVNPISGGFHAIPIRTVLEHEMDSTLYDWSIVETQYAGHAEILAREYAEKGYDAVIQFDGDGQHEARFLPALLRPIEEGRAELVIGSRDRHGTGHYPMRVRQRTGQASWNLHESNQGSQETQQSQD